MFLNSLSDAVDTSAPYPPWHGGGTLQEALARYGDSISERAKQIVVQDYADYAAARNKSKAGIVTTKGGMEVHLDELPVDGSGEFEIPPGEPQSPRILGSVSSGPPHPVDDYEIPPGEPQAPRIGGESRTSAATQGGRELALQNGFAFGYINGNPGNWSLDEYAAAGVTVPTDEESARLYAAYSSPSVSVSGGAKPLFQSEITTPGAGPTQQQTTAPQTDTGIAPLVRYGLLALTAWSLLK